MLGGVGVGSGGGGCVRERKNTSLVDQESSPSPYSKNLARLSLANNLGRQAMSLEMKQEFASLVAPCG